MIKINFVSWGALESAVLGGHTAMLGFRIIGFAVLRKCCIGWSRGDVRFSYHWVRCVEKVLYWVV